MQFVDALCVEKPDIVALQEVNQSCSAEVVPTRELVGYCPCGEQVIIRQDNHVWQVIKSLREKGIAYEWTWLPLKKGYDKYDEGIALMSLQPIEKTDVLLVSNVDDYENWKTRKILGISTKEYPNEWFYSVHYGWWDDEEEPFGEQWKKTDSHMAKENTVWLLGDFNNPAQIRNEGYDWIKDSSWWDSFVSAEKKDTGITVGTVIDGWREKMKDTSGMRIDQIWCNQKTEVKCSKVIFDGKEYPVVSDHYGVLIEVKRR